MPEVQIQKIHTFTGHRDCVYTLQPGPEPSVFFSGAGDGMVVQWDMKNPETGERIAQLPNSVYALHYMQVPDILLVGHNYEGIHVLDWRNKKEVASLKLTTSAIFDIQSFEKNCFIASGDGSVSVVDLASMTIKKTLNYSEKNARALAINPITRELAVGYSDHFIRIFSLDDFNLKYEWAGHVNSVFTLVYSPDYKYLLSGSRDARLKAWEVDQKYNLHREVIAHLYAINNIAFSPEGKHFVTCSMDKSIKVWRSEDLTLLKVIDKARHAGHGTSGNKLLWSSFHGQLISASDDRTISLWDVIF